MGRTQTIRKKQNIRLWIIVVVAIIILLALKLYKPVPTKAMMLLIEFEETKGLKNWANELKERNMPGVILVQHNIVDEHCSDIKHLSEMGFEISGLYAAEAFWNKNYTFQYENMKEVKDKIENCTGKVMRSFGSRYFAYDEITLKVAEELGIQYIFARGTTGARATVYKPEEYNVKIISVSNVPSKEWGTGSLCDYSLWARGESPSDFETIAIQSFNSNDKVILVSHAYLGGTKLRWWNAYQKVLDTVNAEWLTLDEFAVVDYETPFAKIPVNREVKYEVPKPKIPLEEEPECLSEELACY
ncbi:MAG: polysaccharide deacetylase family protein [Candidatus Aenigmatarchaeota archaeon]|nr:polysaccharide deacetylase family protein [Candidatus Aenigmarchaeota archaeon]